MRASSSALQGGSTHMHGYISMVEPLIQDTLTQLYITYYPCFDAPVMNVSTVAF